MHYGLDVALGIFPFRCKAGVRQRHIALVAVDAFDLPYVELPSQASQYNLYGSLGNFKSEICSNTTSYRLVGNLFDFVVCKDL